jgi:anti-sigma factor RsiW
MSCKWRGKLDAYADGELQGSELEQLQVHLSTCSTCTTEALGRMQLKRSVHAAAADSFVPSAEFRTKLFDSIHVVRSPRRGLWPSLVFATAIIVTVLVGALALLQRRGQSDVFAETVDLHVSALASANPVDVISSDRHTVKPWFQGRLPFTFNLPELQNSDFRLIGGRMAYIEHSPAAQLLFGVRKHEISVFILQDSESVAKRMGGQTTAHRLEFNLDTWAQNGLRYIVVSDTNSADVAALSSLLRATQ